MRSQPGGNTPPQGQSHHLVEGYQSHLGPATHVTLHKSNPRGLCTLRHSFNVFPISREALKPGIPHKFEIRGGTHD